VRDAPGRVQRGHAGRAPGELRGPGARSAREFEHVTGRSKRIEGRPQLVFRALDGVILELSGHRAVVGGLLGEERFKRSSVPRAGFITSAALPIAR